MNEIAVPSEIPPHDRNTLVGVLQRGSDRDTAARLIGITLSELRKRLARDPGLSAEMRKAEALCEFRHMETLQKAAQDVKNWRVSVWWLERRAPERYGRRSADAITKRHLEAFVDGLANAITDDSHGEVRDRLVSRMQELIASFDEHSIGEIATPTHPADFVPDDTCDTDVETKP